MGIKNLGKYVSKYGVPRGLAELRGKSVAIDTPIYLFRFKYLSSTEQMLNRFSDQINTFLANEILPVYIFDGKHPEEKKETQESRKQNQVISISKEEIQALKDNFTKSGVKWIVAPSEAEKMCSYLNKVDLIDYVLSNDYDTFVFGCKKLLTANKGTYTEFAPDEILKDLGISRDQFLEICISAGCDFYPQGIVGIGVIKALKLAKKNVPIEEWCSPEESEFLEKLDKIKSIFTDFSEEELVAKTISFVPQNSEMEVESVVSVIASVPSSEELLDDLDQ
jgi:5'-3' exonuclease